MKRILFVSFLLVTGYVLPGCSDILGNSYNVEIDPSFSEENQKEIRTAISLWQDALGDQLRIMSVTVGNCKGALFDTAGAPQTESFSFDFPDPGPQRLICIHASTESFVAARSSDGYVAIGMTCRHPTNDSADIFIPVDREPFFGKPYYFVQTVAHELGHAMGLEHIQENTLMYWAADGQNLSPTCDDTAQWLGLRNESTITAKCRNGGLYHFDH